MGGRVDVPKLFDWEDVFNNQVAGRTNVLDIAAHYPYSPERWRLFSDGSRLFPQYGAVAQYDHAGDYHRLQPAAGETVTLESAERPRYVVQFELAATLAFATNQTLQTGDSIRIGLYDGSNGWYIEQTGSHADDKGDAVLERDGVEVYRSENLPLSVPVTRNSRLKLQTGWYDVTRNKWVTSYAEDGEQQNDLVGKIDKGDARGSKTGNLPLHYEVTAGGSTTGLELHAGSCAQANLGRTTQFNRSKKTFQTDTVSVTGAWEPLRAFRIDPDRSVVATQFSNVAVGKYTANTDIELAILAGDPSKVLDANGNPLTDADYETPVASSDANNVIETTTAVEQFPDDAGTPQTSMVDPGGWQLARSELLNASGKALASTAALGVEAKRPLYSRDVGVVLARSDTAADVSYQVQTEQDW